MTRRQCIPARLDQYVNHDPRLIFKARLVFKARLLFEEIWYLYSALSWVTHLQGDQVWHVLTSDHAVFTYTIHKWNEPYLPLLPSRNASSHFMAGTHFPFRWVGRLSWPKWLVTSRWCTRPQTVTHPSTNRARRRVTSLTLPEKRATTKPSRHLK